MEILWRGDEYEFTPRTIQGGGDQWTKFSNIDAPIFGADTESVQLADRYEPQCFTLASSSRGSDLVYLEPNCFALERFLQFIVAAYGDELEDAKHAFIYFHNLEYDWLQLVKNNETLLEMARIGVGLATDHKIGRVGNYNIVLKKDAIFTGSAPHFTIRLQARRGGFNLFFRDTFSFFPGSLARVSSDLGLGAKMDRQEDLGQVDYRTIPDSDERKQYFEQYAKIDAENTRMIGERIRELHKNARMTKIRASSPSYAIARVYHILGEERAIKTGTWEEDIMQLIFDTYRGGRTGGIYHGRIENCSILDFHSSYPASMKSLPSFSPDMAYYRVEDLSLDNVLAILKETGNCFLRVSGYESDPHYPSLITTLNGKLTPIYGHFSNIATTGVELYVGLMSGSLHNVTVHDMVVLLDMEEEPFLPFREFAIAAYARKEASAKGSVEYTSAKFELNAAYGKLIESRTQTLIGASDYKTHFPFIEGMEKEFGNFYYKKYVEAIEVGKKLDDIYEEILDELIENFEEDVRANMQDKMFGDFSISGRIYGRHVIPAAASLITATSRARLCAAMKATKALYWDTDSIFIQGYDPATINETLAKSDTWLPDNVQKLRIGDELGDLDCEIENASGYLAGIKRYYLEAGDKVKSAIHGIPALDKKQAKDVIAALASGTNYRYTSKPKPMKAKEAKSVAEIGSFRSRSYLSEFHLDERLAWEPTGAGYVGSVKPFAEMGVKELSDADYEKYLERLYRDELSIDPIRQACEQHGFIKCIDPGQMYRGEYERLSRSTRAKYFRRNGMPIDAFADIVQMTVADLFDQLNH